MHLDRLAGGDVQEGVAEYRVWDRTLRELGGDLAQYPRLLGLQDAAGDFVAHHERVAALLLRVHPDPLETLHLTVNRLQ